MPKHELPPLPYDYNALEPHIDEQTMRIHHDKHHGGYVNKLNAALEKHSQFLEWNVQKLLRNINEVPEDIRTAVRNNGGGHANHSLFWQIMKPGGGGQPKGELADALNGAFGGFDALKQQFTDTATGVFGSGWAWVTVDGKGKLAIESTPNQDSPFMQGRTPILGLDVWEHAYYLKYQNKRADYINAWWNVVNWEGVAKQLKAVAK